jgi:hypothetical protein
MHGAATATAPMAAATAASSTTSAATATATTATFSERHIGRAEGDPERADAGGKSYDDELNGKLFADRAQDFHDVFLPQKGVSSGARPTRF